MRGEFWLGLGSKLRRCLGEGVVLWFWDVTARRERKHAESVGCGVTLSVWNQAHRHLTLDFSHNNHFNP